MAKIAWGALLGLAVVLTGCNQNLGDSHVNDENTAGIISGDYVRSRAPNGSRAVVGLEFLSTEEGPRFGCSGTLIGENVVLTAAHCFDPKVMRACRMVNVIFDSKYRSSGSREVRAITSVKPHPRFNTLREYLTNPIKVLDHDIALVFFAGGAPAGFAPAAIESDMTADYSGTSAFVFGYGRAKEYVYGVNESTSYSIGDLRLGRMDIEDYGKEKIRYYTSENSLQKLCQGDSGGPQFVVDSRGARIIGVNSAGGYKTPQGFQCTVGRGMAAKVAYFADWIRKEMKFENKGRKK